MSTKPDGTEEIQETPIEETPDTIETGTTREAIVNAEVSKPPMIEGSDNKTFFDVFIEAKKSIPVPPKTLNKEDKWAIEGEEFSKQFETEDEAKEAFDYLYEEQMQAALEAEMLSLNEGTVKKYFHRAVQNIRKNIRL